MSEATAEEKTIFNDKAEYERLINKQQLKHPGVILSFDQQVQVDQLRELKGINSKMGFFVLLTVLAIILSFIQVLIR